MANDVKVKICGLCSYDDAKVALDGGAWALGFVFHRSSPRYIEPRAAARIVEQLPPEALTVGVFVDYELAELADVVRQVGLRGVQLHGGETTAYAQQVEAELVLKALRVRGALAPELLGEFPGCQLLLDTYHERLPGGTGATFDWAVARRAGETRPVLVAGGLTPENVEEALDAARPEGVDVSGGVEASPGVKDAAKVRRFLSRVQSWRG
jgi:phosphoribosylanthranilate isomerase